MASLKALARTTSPPGVPPRGAPGLAAVQLQYVFLRQTRDASGASSSSRASRDATAIYCCSNHPEAGPGAGPPLSPTSSSTPPHPPPTCRFSGGGGSITAFQALTVGNCGVQWSAVEDRRREVSTCVPRYSRPPA